MEPSAPSMADDVALRKAYVHGVSTRAMGDLVRAMGGGDLQEPREAGCARSSTNGTMPFSPGRSRGRRPRRRPSLWIDATCLKVRQSGRIVSVAVTIAVGVITDGRREVLGMAIGPSEAFGLASPFWTDFLREFLRRGLSA